MQSRRGRAIVLLALAALPVLPLLRAQDQHAPLRELFAHTRAAGPDSPAAGDLRRHGPAAVAFLDAVLQEPGATRPDVLHALDHLMRMPGTGPAVPAMLELLRRDPGGPDREVVGRAAIALGEVGPFLGAETRAQIATGLQECAQRCAPSDRQLGSFLARSWSRVQVAPTSEVARLEELLRSGNPFRIELACQLLAEAGPPARSVMPSVGALAQRERIAIEGPLQGELAGAGFHCHPDWTATVREALYRLAIRVAPDDPAALPLYRQRLAGAGPAAQAALVRHIARLGAAAAAATPELTALAQEGPPVVAREAVTALGMIGPGALAARPVLERLAQSDDRQLAVRARAALRQLGAGETAGGR